MSPAQTIFEINASSRDLSSQVMRAKRQKDRKAIASFQQGRKGRQEGPAGPARGLPAPREEQREEEQAAGENVEVRAPPPGDCGVWARGWGNGWVKSQQPWGCRQGLEQLRGVDAAVPAPPLTPAEVSDSASASPSAEWGCGTCPAPLARNPGGQMCFGIQNL